MADRFGAQDALFTAKCFVAAMLAYYIALRIGLTRPYWAVTTSYIVAQPLAGAVLSKAVFRVIGTIMGAVAAVILVPNLVNAPELLALALALWLAVCLYISLLDRTPRAYMFLLAGYTASIIGFPSVLAPGEIFTTSVLRVEEITIGILCGSLVHGLVFPRSVTSALLARVDAILADAERWSRDSLAIESEEATLDRDRRRLALDINELHQLSIHLPFDTARLLPRVRTLRALQAELSMLLPLASAVDDRIAELARGSDAPRPEALALIEDVRAWLRDPPASLVERTDSADRLIERARLLEPAESLVWRDALRLSLLARLGELVDAHRNARDLRDQLRSPSRAPVTPAVALLLARSNRRMLHRDHGQAIRSGFGTVATILLGCAFWIGTGWADGAGAVLIAGVCCALFGASDDPAPTIMQFLYGTIIGLSVSSVYAFAILPRVTDFVTLAAVLAPPLLLGGMFMARPGTMLLALGAMLGGINTVGLNDRFGESFAVFLNGGLAQLVGTFFAVVTVRLFQTVGAETSARRLIRAGWRDLARRSDLPGRPDPVGWISKMLDRIGLLAPRLAAQGQDPGKPLLDALADLRVGVAVAELRQLRIDGTAAEGALVSPVLSGVGRHYRALRPDEPAPPEPVLLNAIDGALAGLSGERRRVGVLALTSLRRNLFPSAPGWKVAA